MKYWHFVEIGPLGWRVARRTEIPGVIPQEHTVYASISNPRMAAAMCQSLNSMPQERALAA